MTITDLLMNKVRYMYMYIESKIHLANLGLQLFIYLPVQFISKFQTCKLINCGLI